MKTSDILEMANVLPINEKSDNIIFVNSYSLSMSDAYRLRKILMAKNEANFGCVVLIRGNPNENVKLISSDKIEEIV